MNTDKVLEEYQTKFEKFLQEIKQKHDEEKLKDCFLPHIPGWGKEYFSTEKRVLYIGIETNGWVRFDEFLEEYKEEKEEEKIKKYVKSSKESIEGYKFLIWLSNSAFWEFILKLQFEIHGMKYEEFDRVWREPKNLIDIIKDIEEKFRMPLQSFCWANTNSMEEFKGQEKTVKRIWDDVKQIAEKEFDSLDLIVKILKPKLVVILNGSMPSRFYSNIIKKWEEISTDKKFIYYAYKDNIDNINTHFIWTYHPQYMKRKQSFKPHLEEISKLIKDKVFQT
jgi:hypothetical protein